MHTYKINILQLFIKYKIDQKHVIKGWICMQDSYLHGNNFPGSHIFIIPATPTWRNPNWTQFQTKPSKNWNLSKTLKWALTKAYLIKSYPGWAEFVQYSTA